MTPTTATQTAANNIARLMGEHEVVASRFAYRVGTTPPTLRSHLKTGKFALPTLLAMADYFNVSLAELVGA